MYHITIRFIEEFYWEYLNLGKIYMLYIKISFLKASENGNFQFMTIPKAFIYDQFYIYLIIIIIFFI